MPLLSRSRKTLSPVNCNSPSPRVEMWLLDNERRKMPSAEKLEMAAGARAVILLLSRNKISDSPKNDVINVSGTSANRLSYRVRHTAWDQ